jgi:hypothetical protein
MIVKDIISLTDTHSKQPSIGMAYLVVVGSDIFYFHFIYLYVRTRSSCCSSAATPFFVLSIPSFLLPCVRERARARAAPTYVETSF